MYPFGYVFILPRGPGDVKLPFSVFLSFARSVLRKVALLFQPVDALLKRALFLYILDQEALILFLLLCFEQDQSRFDYKEVPVCCIVATTLV